MDSQDWSSPSCVTARGQEHRICIWGSYRCTQHRSVSYPSFLWPFPNGCGRRRIHLVEKYWVPAIVENFARVGSIAWSERAVTPTTTHIPRSSSPLQGELVLRALSLSALTSLCRKFLLFHFHFLFQFQFPLTPLSFCGDADWVQGLVHPRQELHPWITASGFCFAIIFCIIIYRVLPSYQTSLKHTLRPTQALRVTDLPASAPKWLGLQVCAKIPSLLPLF